MRSGHGFRAFLDGAGVFHGVAVCGAFSSCDFSPPLLIWLPFRDGFPRPSSRYHFLPDQSLGGFSGGCWAAGRPPRGAGAWAWVGLQFAFCNLHFAICNLHFSICTLQLPICNLHFAFSDLHLHFSICICRFAFAPVRLHLHPFAPKTEALICVLSRFFMRGGTVEPPKMAVFPVCVGCGTFL